MVTTNTLDFFEGLQRRFNFKRPFLKMDAQGFNIEVVKGGAQSMRDFFA